MPPKKQPFEIGLVMAGAVSAGAYTAGVVDYLLDVLDTWQEAKEKNLAGVPMHDVVIKVITGASAGGMTAAILAMELQMRKGRPAGQRSLLHQAWVQEIDIKRLLETNDLKKRSAPVKSILDSSVIDDIADKIILGNIDATYHPIPYVSDELKIYLTLSNLRGLPYKFPLKGETGFPYGMTDHSDYQFMVLCNKTTQDDWRKLRRAAVATGAFPVGLAARLIKRDTFEYRERLSKDGRPLSGLMAMDNTVDKAYNFVAVDGGMLNNEPIELARSVWENRNNGTTPNAKGSTTKQTGDARDYVKEKHDMDEELKATNHAIIMVDPFPDLVDEGKDAEEDDTGLLNIIGPIIGALRAQSLFKLDELLLAGDKDFYTRYLIAPIRYENGSLANHAIASGFLGGFGGFFAREFRDHDYELGRRNCQKFLREYFALPREIAEKTLTAGISTGYIFTNGGPAEYYPIIPILKGTNVNDEQGAGNKWPQYSPEHYGVLEQNVRNRAEALVAKTLPLSWFGSRTALLVIILLAMLVVAGEFIKGAHGCRTFLVAGLSNLYILIFQAVLLLALAFIGALRLVCWRIKCKIVTYSLKTIVKSMKSWGIDANV